MALMRNILHPLSFLLLYVAVICGFAAAYEYDENAAFYAPYARLESTSRDDYDRLERVPRAKSDAPSTCDEEVGKLPVASRV